MDFTTRFVQKQAKKSAAQQKSHTAGRHFTGHQPLCPLISHLAVILSTAKDLIGSLLSPLLAVILSAAKDLIGSLLSPLLAVILSAAKDLIGSLLSPLLAVILSAAKDLIGSLLNPES